MRATCKRAVYAVSLLAIFSYIAFFYRLGDLAFIGADEARYAEVAREMVEHHDYVTPRLDYRPWFEKPPLYYWTTALFFHWLGVSEFSARLGSALLALSGVLFVFFFGGKVFSYRVGFLSALILLTSSEYFVLGRAATTDIGLAVTLTIGLGCFYMGLITPTPSRIFFSLAAYPFFGLAVLAKGPAGILLPLLIILGYFISTRQYHKVYEIQLLPGLLLFLVVVLPWHILMIERHRFAFIASFFLNHNLARFFTRLHHHAQPAYYFLGVIAVGFFPWSSFLPAAAKRGVSLWRRPLDDERRALIFLWMWTLVIILFFSISRSKLAGYILPAMPAMALLVGCEWAAFTADDEPVERWMKFCCYLYLALAMGLAVALPVFLRIRYGLGGFILWTFASLYAISVALALLQLIRRARLPVFAAVALTPLLLVVLTAQSLFPVIADYQSVKEIAARAAQLTPPNGALITYQFEDYNLKYYSGIRSLQVTTSPDELAALLKREKRPLHCIVLQRGISDLEGYWQFETTRVYERGNKILLRIQPHR